MTRPRRAIAAVVSIARRRRRRSPPAARTRRAPLTVYSAQHESLWSGPGLEAFTKETGIRLRCAGSDMEFANQIVQEGRHRRPMCS